MDFGCSVAIIARHDGQNVDLWASPVGAVNAGAQDGRMAGRASVGE
jgi:hypothetical protein